MFRRFLGDKKVKPRVKARTDGLRWIDQWQYMVNPSLVAHMSNAPHLIVLVFGLDTARACGAASGRLDSDEMGYRV